MSFSHTSTCQCCAECENHLTNPRFGYIIPCNEKFQCPKFQEMQEQSRIAKEREKQYKADERVAIDYALRRKKRRK